MHGRALASVAAIALSAAAAMADGPPPAPLPPPVPVACCERPPLWTGVYVGLLAGGAWSQSSWSFPFAESFTTLPGQSFSQAASGALWGGHIGVNYQWQRFVVGAEVSLADNRLNAARTGPFAASPGDRFIIEAGDLLTVTGRLGLVVHDQYLFYAKGGYANSQIDLSATSLAGVTAHVSAREQGWVVGGGLDTRVVSNILFGLEYNFIGFSGDRFASVTGGALVGPFNADIGNPHMHTFVARLSILFGPYACCSEGLLGKY